MSFTFALSPVLRGLRLTLVLKRSSIVVVAYVIKPTASAESLADNFLTRGFGPRSYVAWLWGVRNWTGLVLVYLSGQGSAEDGH